MLPILGDTTNTDAIRAVIGVGEAANELPDSYFTARKMEQALALELSVWLPDSLENIQDDGESGSDGSPEQMAWFAVQQASTYWCAWECARTAPISLFQKIEDGQNAVTRPTMKLQELLKELKDGYLNAKDKALDLLGPEPTVANTTWMFGTAPPIFDPVTG